MTLVLAIFIGALSGLAIYLMLRQSIVDMVFGLILLNHATNLLVFTADAYMRGAPPLESETTDLVADPLPQALVLTAIVISFGLTSFLIVLVAQFYNITGTDDVDTTSPEKP